MHATIIMTAIGHYLRPEYDVDNAYANTLYDHVSCLHFWRPLCILFVVYVFSLNEDSSQTNAITNTLVAVYHNRQMHGDGDHTIYITKILPVTKVR